jgi:hypothetical protein
MRERRVLLLFCAALLLAWLPMGGRGAAPQGIDCDLECAAKRFGLQLLDRSPLELPVSEIAKAAALAPHSKSESRLS